MPTNFGASPGFLVPVLLVAIIAFGLKPLHQHLLHPDIPMHMKGKEMIVIPDLLTRDEARSLNEMLKAFGSLPSNLADSRVTKPVHEHIGEAVDIQSPPLSLCPHPYMVPDLNRTKCILANRIDIGRHYITTGGIDGVKEPYEVAVGRLQSFGKYIFDPRSYPVVQKLFSGKAFQSAAERTCPPNKQVLDPFQFNLIVQVPGQTVATHIDGVYFWGATRFELPQWLLAAMKFSGLFESKFIDQVQIVGYFHDWDDDDRKGNFVYWNDDEPYPVIVPPKPRSGSGIDGSKVIHAANVYHPDFKPPMTDKNKQVELRYDGRDDTWTVYEDDIKTPYAYTTNELRSTIVFRARCFESEEAKARFNNSMSIDNIPLSDVLSTLRKDMEEKTGDDFSSLSKLDLGIKIMDFYIKYPYPRDAIIPVNYCVLEKMLGGGTFVRGIFRDILMC